MKTILIVDDDPKYRFLLRTKLEKAGYTVLEAVDGDKGLEVVKNNAQVDLILLDLLMPGTDGLTFYYHFKKSLASDIPIIILSNLNVTAYPTEIKDYIVKTDISLNDLVTKINSYLQGGV